MKIFAKRKRKLENTDDSGIAATKTEPDPVVQEILKQDPSTWNAKQRRLVKRYEERTKSLTSSTVSEAAAATTESQAKFDGPSTDEKDVVAASGGAIDDFVVTEPADQLPSSQDANEKNAQSDPVATNQDTEPKSSNTESMSIDAELQGILDQLNSKQRRKLVRQLERGGTLEEVRLEATRCLKEGEAKILPPPAVEPPAEAEPPLKKARTRRPPVDPSTLTPEERQRRDEQRRLQQAAAEARQKGTLPQQPHKHPLNSERRRANRRKPKWEPKSQSTGRPHNEHDSSGYHLRKITKAER